jgi:hypothetical protein
MAPPAFPLLPMRALRSTVIALTQAANRWGDSCFMTDATSILEVFEYASRHLDHGHPVVVVRRE